MRRTSQDPCTDPDRDASRPPGGRHRLHGARARRVERRGEDDPVGRHAARRLRARSCSVLALSIPIALASLAPGSASADEAERFDRVSFAAESSREVANDEIVATLAVELEDQRPDRLADRVNETMAWALDRARRAENVSVESGGYRTFPIQRDGRIDRWRAQQELRLDSRDAEAVTELIGELQEKLTVRGLTFQVSDERRREVENELIAEALAAFETRAAIVRTQLGVTAHKLVHLSIATDGSGPRPVPMQRSRVQMMSESVAAPEVEAGRSSVRVSVQGTIELR